MLMKHMILSTQGRAHLRQEIKACLALAVPLAAAQVAQQGTSFADTVMMGLLGSEAIAAGGLGAISFGTLLIVCTGVVSAVSPLVAEAYGREKFDRVGQIGRQGLWLSLVIALPMMMLIWNAGSVLRLLGQQEATIAQVVNYLQAVVWGFFPALAFAALRSFVAALSRPRPVMVIMICGLCFNVVGNYVLALGKFGFPALGLAGIGWASTLSYWGTFVALICYILSQRVFDKYNPFRKLLQSEGQVFGELLQIGLPIGALYGVETGLFAVTSFIMGYLGTTTLAAHQIALQTAAITFMVPAGISYATTVRVGQLLGQHRFRQAKLAAYVNLGIGGTFMGMMAVAFWVIPQAIVALYLDIDDPANAEVLSIAVLLLRVAAMFQLADGIQVIAVGALRGLQDTRAPMLIGIFAYWCVGLSSGYWLGLRWGWDGVGLWFGLALGLATAATIFTWRFNRLIAAFIHRSE
jgi:MATE family multidrug resistance protein